MPARYTHDCDRCRFVAAVTKYDIYICPATHGGPSLIARYGDAGPAYASMCDFRREMLTTVQRETAGLTEDAAIIAATFRLMPSLLWNVATPHPITGNATPEPFRWIVACLDDQIGPNAPPYTLATRKGL